MATGKIVLKTVEEFMEDYTPVYTPIYPLFMGKSVQYESTVGVINYRRVEAIGDIRAQHITPKDTEIKQVNVTDAQKSYKKYFLANQYIVSELQDTEGAADVIAQVLDEHHVQMDEMLMLGEGTSAATAVNNGLYWSSDVNYLLETSTEIAFADRLADLHSKVVASATKANQIAGRKVIMFYGSGIVLLFNQIYSTSSRAFKAVLSEVLGPNYSMLEIPEDATPAGANGWIVANMDQVKFHYTVLPELAKQGLNDEKGYYWFNFHMGSVMLEVLAKNAVIRQPATLAVS